MRIRKNAKQSPLSEPVPESLRTQVCQLNQSPWDVTPLSPPTSPSYDHPPYPSLLQANYQFDGEDSLTGNGSFGDSIGAVESSSVASMIDEAEERAAAHIHDNDKYYCATRSDNYHVLDEKEEEDSKMEDPFKDGPSQPILESCGIHNSSSTKKAQKQASSVVSSRRGRPRTVQVKTKGSTSAAAANPYDFYYYSGFGPSWRKRRGDRAGDDDDHHHQVQQQKDNSDHDQEFKECDNDNSIITTQNNTASFGGSHHRNSNRNNEHEFSYLLDEDDDDEDEEEEEIGRKRMRKPVKARSLKSLM